MLIQLFCVAVSATSAIGSQKFHDSDVVHAINMITHELQTRHDEERCWDSVDPSNGWLSRHRGGTTALTTLALLSAGESSYAPQIQRALDYIWENEQPSSYLLTLRTSIWALLPETYKRRLKTDTKKLIKTMSLEFGGWGIGSSHPLSFSSTSPLTREFGIIALREAQRRGNRISRKYWCAIADATLTTQHDDGGWSYEQSRSSGNTTSNMTVAGLNCLLGVNEAFGDELNKADAFILQNAIDKALAWLDKHATTKNTGGTALMSYLYALERVAMSCGLSEIRRRDWYRDGVSAVIDAHCGVRKAKGSTVNLSFALLFLTRGRSPVAICELTTKKGLIDPHRVADTITKRISETTERTLSWQFVTSNESIQTWLRAPLLFIQRTDALPDDTESCSEYLDNGGLIVLLASGKDLKTCKEFAQTLCPTISSVESRNDHWSHSLIDNAAGVPITTWNDGVRDRIILVQGSGKKLRRSRNSKLVTLLTNVCCGAAELDTWKPKLKIEENQVSHKTIIIAEHDGRWDAELEVFNRWNCKSMPLDESETKKIVWVGGIHTSEATNKLIQSVITVASSGSKVIVESIGGKGHFAKAVMQKIVIETGIQVETDLLLQQFIGRRAWSIQNRKVLPQILTATVGKGSLIFVDCDLRNALLGHPTWGVHGYSNESAKELVKTIVNR